MSMLNNPFVRVCTSGFGTGTTAGRALGYTVLLFAFAFIALSIYCAGAIGCFSVVKLREALSRSAIDGVLYTG